MLTHVACYRGERASDGHTVCESQCLGDEHRGSTLRNVVKHCQHAARLAEFAEQVRGAGIWSAYSEKIHALSVAIK